MAARKTTATKSAEPKAPEEEAKSPDPEPTDEVQAPEEEEAKSPDPTPTDESQEEGDSQLNMVKVRNLRHLDYVQPSTGIRIHGGSEKLLLDDVWLELQCDARLLEKV